MKGNAHKKDYSEDKFARKFYCDHARLNQLRADKKSSRRKTRRKLNKIAKKDLTNNQKYDIIKILKER